MRPTDEDQAGSRRPNLMSTPRRSGADVNILAMLDRHAARPRARRWLAWPMAAWYGAAGVLACGLLAGLAWAVHDAGGDGGGAHDTVAIVPAPAPAPATVADAAAVPVPAFEAAAVASPALAPVARPAQQPATQPVLPPAPQADTVLQAVAAPAPSPAQRPDGRHAGERSAASLTPQRVLVHTPAPRSHPALPGARVLAHALPLPSRQQTSRARPSAATAKKGAAGATPAVDNDVALISAIIEHVNSHGQAAGDGLGTPPGHKNHETP